MIFLYFALLSVSLLWRPDESLDLWWHLKTGQLMWEQGRIFTTDIFSYTAFGQPWINHEWLAEIVYAFIFKYFNLSGLVVFRCFLGSLIGFILYRWTLLLCGRRSLSLLLASIAFWVASPRFMEHPSLFSTLFTLFILWIVSGVQSGFLSQKTYFWFLGLFPLWVNIHSGFVLGLAVLFLFWVPDFLKTKKKGEVFLFLLIVASCFLSPFTYQTLIFPLTHMGLHVPLQNTVEWLSPFNPEALTRTIEGERFPIVFFLIGFIFLLNRRSIKVPYLLVFGLMGCLSMKAIRFFSDFVLVAAPLLAMILIDKIHRVRWIDQILVSLSVVLLLFSVTTGFKRGDFQTQLERQLDGISSAYTPDIVQFLEENHLSGLVFNDQNLAPTFIFLRGPREKVFVDGRHAIYGNQHFEDFFNAVSDKRKFLALDQKYGGFDYILLSESSNLRYLSLQKYLWESPDWVLVYYSQKGYVYLRRKARFDSVVEHFAIHKPPLSLRRSLPFLQEKI